MRGAGLRRTLILCLSTIFSSVLTAPATLAAPLNVNDAVIVAANADSTYSLTACTSQPPHSNGISILLRAPMTAGETLHVTDKSWDGSTLSSSEGTITYTAPTDLAAGTLIHYSDCILQTVPSDWTRSGSFDPAAGGDTLLIYQGLSTAPNFIDGFGYRSNPWISSGTPTSNNSYIPSTLAAAHTTGTSSGRDYQYTGSTTGIYADTFLTDVRDMSNWTISTTNAPFDLVNTALSFDGTRPTITSVTAHEPLTAMTSGDTVTFRVVLSEAVVTPDASDFTITTTGDTAYIGIVLTAIDATTYDLIVNGITGEGAVELTSHNGTFRDMAGNPSLDTSFTPVSYTIASTTGPVNDSGSHDTLSIPTANTSQLAATGTDASVIATVALALIIGALGLVRYTHRARPAQYR